MFAGEEDICVKEGEGGRRAASTAASNNFSLLRIAWCCEFDFSLILEMILNTVSEDILAESAKTRMSSEKLSISIQRSDKSPWTKPPEVRLA